MIKAVPRQVEGFCFSLHVCSYELLCTRGLLSCPKKSWRTRLYPVVHPTHVCTCSEAWALFFQRSDQEWKANIGVILIFFPMQ